MVPRDETPIFFHVRTHLVLGRVSNLPTVWSNCFAAWVLAQGSFTPALIFVLASMSCLYVGGMYLNDACDAAHDAQYKRDRPIPQGRIHRSTVFGTSFALMLLGLILAFSWGWLSLFGATLLTLMIIAYNVLHLYLRWSPIIMGGCRALLYVAVGLAAGGEYSFVNLLLWAGLLGLYVAGLSYVARVEESNILKRWTLLCAVFIPAFVNVYPFNDPARTIASVVALAWIVYCLAYVVRPHSRDLKRAVGGLIAGICLVDLLAVGHVMSPNPLTWQILIVGCFALTILAQKFVPAT